jgi:hypothetical protein
MPVERCKLHLGSDSKLQAGKAHLVISKRKQGCCATKEGHLQEVNRWDVQVAHQIGKGPPALSLALRANCPLVSLSFSLT